MWYSPKQLREMMWDDKANTLLKDINYDESLHKPWRKAKPKIEKDYIKLNEYEHWKIFHKFLVKLWVRHTHIWNEAWQSWSKNIVIMMAKKKASGVSKWYPDYVIYPIVNWKKYTLYIELKKAKWPQWWLNWSSISDEQVEWIEFLNWVEWSGAYIAHWYKEAQKIYYNFLEDAVFL